MNRHRLVTVLLAGVLLVGGANLGAFAATGSPLLLGKGNTATKTTKLKTTGDGPALKIKTKPTAPPFAVSSSTKVAKLNADLVDGRDSSDLTTTSYVYSLAGTRTPGVLRFQFPSLPAGIYDVAWDVAADLGGSPPYFGCFFGAVGSEFGLKVLGLGDTDGDTWIASAAGQLDTRTATYDFYCQGGTSLTIPASNVYTAEVVFTKVDARVARSSTGVAPPARGVPRARLGR